MYYLIRSGRVAAKYSDPMDVISHRDIWIESDEDVPMGSDYDGEKFSADPQQEAMKLLLKLAQPIESADIATKQDLTNKLGVK